MSFRLHCRGKQRNKAQRPTVATEYIRRATRCTDVFKKIELRISSHRISWPCEFQCMRMHAIRSFSHRTDEPIHYPTLLSGLANAANHTQTNWLSVLVYISVLASQFNIASSRSQRLPKQNMQVSPFQSKYKFGVLAPSHGALSTALSNANLLSTTQREGHTARSPPKLYLSKLHDHACPHTDVLQSSYTAVGSKPESQTPHCTIPPPHSDPFKYQTSCRPPCI
jgi:hypothetical protein